jgi:hypothetical protein
LFILDPSKTVICVRNGSSAHQIATVCQRNGPKNTGGTFYGLCDIDDGEQYTVAQSQRRSRTTTSGKKKKKKKKKKKNPKFGCVTKYKMEIDKEKFLLLLMFQSATCVK